MVLSKHLHAIRQKPQHVRERILLTCLIVVVPLLLIGGYFAFRYERSHAKKGSNGEMFKNLGAFFSGTAKDMKDDMSQFTQGQEGVE